MINGISHVAIVVGDFEKSLSFYRDLLGFSRVRFRDRPDGMKIAFLARPGHDVRGQYEIELLSYPSPAVLPEEAKLPNTVGMRHVALLVDNIDEVYANLRDKGVEFAREPWMPAPDLAKLCSMTDPNGISIELVQFGTGESQKT